MLIKLEGSKHIIKYYYYEEKPDKFYLCFEKCACSLNDLINYENKNFKKNEAKTITFQTIQKLWKDMKFNEDF